MKSKFKIILAVSLAIIILLGLFLFPKGEEVAVADKIQKRSWFIPIVDEDNLILVVDTYIFVTILFLGI